METPEFLVRLFVSSWVYAKDQIHVPTEAVYLYSGECTRVVPWVDRVIAKARINLDANARPDRRKTRLEARLRATRRIRRWCWLEDVGKEGVGDLRSYFPLSPIFLSPLYKVCIRITEVGRKGAVARFGH
jgi:hypothetical protein